MFSFVTAFNKFQNTAAHNYPSFCW